MLQRLRAALVKRFPRLGEHRAPVLFTSSSIWLSVAQLLSGLLMARYVEPKDMGLWSAGTVMLTYSVLILGGVQNGLSRELPYSLGANREDTARRLASATLFFTLAAGLVMLLAGLGITGYYAWTGESTKVVYTAIVVTFLVLCRFYQNYLFLTYRSKNSFQDLAKVQGWQGALMLLSLPLVLLFAYAGLAMRAAIVAGLGLYWMHQSRPMAVRPEWDKGSIWLLLRTGLPIFATDYIATSAATMDRVALLRFGGVESVGFYSLAISASSAFAVLPQSISHYVYPRMSSRYGQTNDPRALWGMAWRTTLIVAGVMIPIAVVGAVLLPWVVPILFPKYVPGTSAAQIALFAGVASGATIGSNALASLKAWRHLMAFQFSYAGLLAAGPFAGAIGTRYGQRGPLVAGMVLVASGVRTRQEIRNDVRTPR